MGIMRCFYPLCTSRTSHFVKACPTLHRRCTECFQRSHKSYHHAEYSMQELKTFNGNFKTQGVFTKLETKFPQWSFDHEDFYDEEHRNETLMFGKKIVQ